jgi:UDP-2,4-diacetamido-2,4,6-trideoxy-beta-L-altropyranose hydrolase
VRRGRPLVVLRPDAGPGCGRGHVARCAALSAALRRLGASTLTLLPDSERAFGRGERVRRFPGASATGGPTARELLGLRPTAWVVDSYRLSARSLQPLRAVAPLWRPMDEPSARADADGTWAPVDHPRSAAKDVVPRRRLFGARYALLPQGLRPARHAKGTRVVVSFGAEDLREMTLPVARAIAADGWDVTAVVGPGVRGRMRVLRDLAALEHVTPRDGRKGLLPLLRRCEWAVLPPSQSMWEALRLGLAVALVETAPNQRAGRRWARKTGAALDCGTAGSARAARGAAALGGRRDDAARAAALRRRAARVVDGRGAARVAAAILASAGASA